MSTLQPDIAYVWNMQHVSITPILAAQDQGVPTVFRLPDYWLAEMKTALGQEANPLKRWYRGLVIGMGGFGRLDTSHLLPNSRALMQVYLQAGFPADSMHLIPSGIPSALIMAPHESLEWQRPGQNDEGRLVCAGRLADEKGLDVAIKALAHLTGVPGFGQVRLDLIGAGSPAYEAELRDLVAYLGLEARVAFVGQLDHQRLLDRYPLYDAVLVPSRWIEPFSRTVLEAMARGLPVIATNRGGTVEIILDGENGLLVPPDDRLRWRKRSGGC